MNAPSIDIKDLLEADASLGLVFGTDLYIGFEPAEPSNCVAIFDTPGAQDDLALDGEVYERKSLQIRVRNSEYQTGWTLANDIKILLHGKNHTTINGTLYTVITCSIGPFLLDWDRNGRARFVVNLDVQRR